MILKRSLSIKNYTAHSRLARTLARIDGAYSHSTIRAYRADFEDFIEFCSTAGKRALPATPIAVADYIGELVRRGRRSASIRRALAGLAAIHQLNGFTDPTKDIEVKLAVRHMHRQLGRYSRQAHGINRHLLEKLLRATTPDLRGCRDRTLLLIAYDTLCRRSELLSLRVEDIRRDTINPKNGKKSVAILLRRSKTDQEAQGRWLMLSDRAVKEPDRWLRQSMLKAGPIIQGVDRAGRLTGGIDPGGPGRVNKKLAIAAKLEDAVVADITGHSTRVGAAQDLILPGANLPLIMHKGRWSKSDTVMRYVERLGVPI